MVLVWFCYGETTVVVAVTGTKTPGRRGLFPLTVDFEKNVRHWHSDPGGFLKREGRPATSALF